MAGAAGAGLSAFPGAALGQTAAPVSDLLRVEDFQTGAGDRAAVQAALDAAVAAAGVVGGSAVISFRPDKTYTFTDGGALKLPPNFAGHRIVIDGNGCKVELTAGCPRMFDFAKQADYDTFRGFEIRRFIVDAGNLPGRGHALVGTLPGANQSQTRLNFRDLSFKEIELRNVSAAIDSTTNRKCIWIASVHDGPNETETTLEDLTFEDLFLDGGRTGILVAGYFTTAQAGGPNVRLGHVAISRCEHTMRTPPTRAALAANFQIGGHARGGTLVMNDCKGRYSSDVGVEVDALDSAVISRTEITDAWTIGFTQNNFVPPTDPATQLVTLRDCHYTREAIPRGKGFGSGGIQNVVQPAPLLYDGCTYRGRSAAPASVGVGSMFSFLSSPRSITIRDCVSDVQGYDLASGTTAAQVDGIYFVPITPGVTELKVRGLTLHHRGRATRGSLQWRGIYQSGGALDVDIQGLTVDVAIAGVQRGGYRIAELARGKASGVIRGINVLAMSADDPAAKGLKLGKAADLDLRDSLRVANCDFSGMPPGSTEIAFDADDNREFVYANGNRWRVFPRPDEQITVGPSPFSHRNLDGYLVLMTLEGGAVTAVELARNGGPFFDTGVRQGQLRVDHGDTVRVSYDASAPTMRKVPES